MNPELELILRNAIQAFQEGDLNSADSHLNQILLEDSGNFPALYVLGLIKASQANYLEAVDLLSRAANIEPNDASIQYNLAKCLADSGAFQQSIPHHEKAVALAPDNSDAWLNYGKTLFDLGQSKQAVQAYDKALGLNADFAEAYINKGIALKKLNQLHEAIDCFDQAIALRSDHAEVWFNKGLILHSLQRHDEALLAYDQALNLKPDYAECWSNKGKALYELKRFEDAIICCNKAIHLKPDEATYYSNKGISMHELKRFNEAIACFDKALSLKPNYAEAWSNKGSTLQELMCYSEAITHYEKAFSLKSEIDWKRGDLLYLKMKTCSWGDFQVSVDDLSKRVYEAQTVAEPFLLLTLKDDISLHQKGANIYIQKKYPLNTSLGNIKLDSKCKKIRVGYFSADFRQHAVSFLMAELFELHDQNRFETIAFSFGEDDHSPLRQRLIKSFTQFIDVKNLSDRKIAELSRSLGIQIAVDLSGFTKGLRTGIFALRAAPIQVNYLGYPGTIGANYFDYVIADKIVITPNEHQYFSERVVYLPNCYQANDRNRLIANKSFNRQDLDLPDDGFVFCCFNNNYKIQPSMFDSWMRILKAVEKSVLWLFQDNPWVAGNLRAEAQKHGIAGNRLIFAPSMNQPEHLARHNQADLFLDTFPYNAHTTASDALWAGLPIITLTGQSFASRVAASLLVSIGLPELITTSKAQYESLAIDLATNPRKLGKIKEKLAKNRLITPLFDSPLLTKHIESAYIQIYERYHKGLPPEHIEILEDSK